MTREEEIRKAAYNLYPHPKADSSRIGFMLGAEWADNHPIKYKKPKITQKMITNREIYLEAVSQLTSISSNDIMSKKKNKSVTQARFLVMWALYRLLKYPLMRIGRLMQRNHTSVWYGIKAIEYEASHKGGERIHDIMTVLRKFSK